MPENKARKKFSGNFYAEKSGGKNRLLEAGKINQEK